MALTITDELGNTIIEVLSPDEIGNTTVEVLLPAVSGAVGPAGATGATGATGSGGEPGGLTGQVLTKASTNDYDYVWEYKYLGRFNLEAATNRALANATGVTVERYFTCTAEGNGESFNIQSNTPSAGNVIRRRIYYKNEAFETTDVNTWTLVHTFADDATYASTATQWAATLEAQTYGKPPFTLAISWQDIPAFEGLLDTYPGAAAAYSVRLLDKDYAGDCIRVRRASDNTEQDIGFDGNGDLDTGALASFCTGTNGFVRTWYDQSGNANHATQTTTANQPKIYDSSTGVLTRNSLPTLQFDGTNDSLLSTSAIDPLFITAANAPNTSGTFKSICGADSDDAVANGSFYFQYNTPARIPVFLRITTADISTSVDFVAKASTAVTNNTMNLLTGTRTTTSINLYVNSITSGNDTTSNALRPVGGVDSGKFRLMASYYNNAVSDYLAGDLSEIIAYTSDQSANRAAIETNINDYFNIF